MNNLARQHEGRTGCMNLWLRASPRTARFRCRLGTAAIWLWFALATPADAAVIGKGTISHPGSNRSGGQTETFSIAFTATVPDVVVVVGTSVADPCGCLVVTGGAVGEIDCHSDGSGSWYCTVSGLTPGAVYTAGFSGFWWYGTGVYTSIDVLEDACPSAPKPKE